MNIYLVIALSILFFLLSILAVYLAVQFRRLNKAVRDQVDPLESLEPMQYQCDICGELLTQEELNSNIGFEVWMCDECFCEDTLPLDGKEAV